MQVKSKETVSAFELPAGADKSVEELEKEFLLLLQGEDTQPTPELGTAFETGDAKGGLSLDHVHLGAAVDTMMKVRTRETEIGQNIKNARADAAMAKERLIHLPGPYMIGGEYYRTAAIKNSQKADI